MDAEEFRKALEQAEKDIPLSLECKHGVTGGICVWRDGELSHEKASEIIMTLYHKLGFNGLEGLKECLKFVMKTGLPVGYSSDGKFYIKPGNE